MTETDLAWAAGFFDGEGSITIARNYGPNLGRGLRMKIAVAQVDPAPLLKLHGMFGGCIRYHYRPTRPEHRVAHEWTVGSRDAMRVLSLLLPYLVNKHEQARLAIAFQQGKGATGKRLDGWKIAEEEAVREAIMEAHRFVYEPIAA